MSALTSPIQEMRRLEKAAGHGKSRGLSAGLGGSRILLSREFILVLTEIIPHMLKRIDYRVAMSVLGFFPLY